MRMRLATLILSPFLLALPQAPAAADSCSGCACRGGPGYRDAKGQCVGHAQLYSRCGTPPTTRCTFEGAAQISRGAVPPEWTREQHTQWLAERNAGKRPDASVPGRSGASPDASLAGRSGASPDASEDSVTTTRQAVP